MNPNYWQLDIAAEMAVPFARPSERITIPYRAPQKVNVTLPTVYTLKMCDIYRDYIRLNQPRPAGFWTRPDLGRKADPAGGRADCNLVLAACSRDGRSVMAGPDSNVRRRYRFSTEQGVAGPGWRARVLGASGSEY